MYPSKVPYLLPSPPLLSPPTSSRGVFLCSFSFFIHAHLFICASVDLRCGPSLQPLVKTHISQALASSNGLQGRKCVCMCGCGCVMCVCVCVCVWLWVCYMCVCVCVAVGVLCGCVMCVCVCVCGVYIDLCTVICTLWMC